MDEISWDDARVFLAVAEQGSFSGAALELRMGQPTVSRRIARLEEELGCALFHRGRRGTTLTAQGERMLDPARQMARWSAQMRAALEGQEEVGGEVTIAAPPGVAYDIMTPFAAALRGKVPGVRVELLSAIDYVDLTRGVADFAVRSKPATEPALMTVATIRVKVRPYATPGYIEGLGEGGRVEDLDWICWGRPYQHLAPRPELEGLFPGFEPAFASSDYMTQVRACELGMGVMWLPVMHHPLLPERELVAVDAGLPEVTGESYIVCARSMREVPRVRAVLDALLDELDALGGGVEWSRQSE